MKNHEIFLDEPSKAFNASIKNLREWRIVKDDGHTYLIPTDLKEAFDNWFDIMYSNKSWIEKDKECEEKNIPDFGLYRIDGYHTLTFMFPKIDGELFNRD